LRVDAPRERSIEAAKSGRPSVSLVATTRQPPPLALPSPYKLPGRHDAPSSPLAKSALPPPPAPPPPPPLQVVKAPPTKLSLHGKGPPAIPPPPGLEPRQIQVKLPESMKPKRAPSEALKMKTIMWTKIAPTSIVNGQGLASVWGELARQSTELSLDFDMIDGMFAVSTSPAPSTHMDSSPAQVASERIASLINKQRFVNCIIHTYIGLNEKGHEYTYNLPSARALTSASVGTKSMSTVSVQ
uniref:FH2 domain-containing protein n=1 Tax=Heligmosomoides polygyrus TaxID=6339 RepID=A0A183FA05_HELPZ